MSDEVNLCLRALPKKLKIGPYDWNVVLLEDVNDNCGQSEFEFHHINLWPANLTSPGHAVGVVIHECLHVIFR